MREYWVRLLRKDVEWRVVAVRESQLNDCGIMLAGEKPFTVSGNVQCVKAGVAIRTDPHQRPDWRSRSNSPDFSACSCSLAKRRSCQNVATLYTVMPEASKWAINGIDGERCMRVPFWPPVREVKR